MLVRKRVVVNVGFQGKSTDDESLNKEIREKYVGYNYCIGTVEDATIVQKGFSKLSRRKNIYAMIPIILDLRIFTIPEDFIVANAELIMIKNNINNNSAYIFKCSFKDEMGNPIVSEIKATNGSMQPKYNGVLNTMNKPPESLKLYKHLAIGDRCNLICRNTFICDGKTQIHFNCDIIEHAEPKYFVHSNSINIDRIKALAVKEKIKLPLFEKHTFDGIIDKLVEGESYAMTIYGFRKIVPETDTIDFIKLEKTKKVERSDRLEDLSIGLDSIDEYLYAVMLNWKCAANNF